MTSEWQFLESARDKRRHPQFDSVNLVQCDQNYQPI